MKWTLFLSLLLTSVGALSGTSAPRAPTPGPTLPITVQDLTDAQGFRTMPLFLGEDYNDGKSSLRKIKKDLRVARELKIPFLRFGFSWLAMEQTKGEYDFAAWDRIVLQARRYGIRLMPYVSYTPGWASEGTFDPGHPPPDPADFARFMGALVRHYNHLAPGTIVSWEIWNEPDVDTWKGDARQFADLVKLASAEIRRADPRTKIILGGLTMGPSGFFWSLLDDHRIGEHVDVFAYHVYPETWWAERIEEILPLWPDTMTEWIQSMAPGKGLWLNEYGYADYRHSVDRASMWSEQPDVFYLHEHTSEDQAVKFFRIQMINLAAGNVAATAWYRIHDYRGPEDINGDGDPVNLRLGLLDVRGKPKPVYFAVRTYQSLFSSGVRNAREVRFREARDSQAVSHAFETPSGDLLVTAWMRSSTLEEASRLSGVLGEILDTRTETVTMVLPETHRESRIEVMNLDGSLARIERPNPQGEVRIPLTGPGFYLARIRLNPDSGAKSQSR